VDKLNKKEAFSLEVLRMDARARFELYLSCLMPLWLDKDFREIVTPQLIVLESLILSSAL